MYTDDLIGRVVPYLHGPTPVVILSTATFESTEAVSHLWHHNKVAIPAVNVVCGCIHVKLEMFKRGRSPSLHLAKEGDLGRNHSATLIVSINIRIPAEILKMMKYSRLIMA